MKKYFENISIKKGLATFLILGLMIGLIGCSKDKKPGKDGADVSDKLSGELVMWTASLSGEPFDSYFANLKEEFEKLHPDIKLTIEDIPQNEIEQKVLTSLTGDAKDIPDLVNLAPRYSDNIASQGGLLDLSDEISKDVMESYFEGPLKSGYHEDRLYALPWYLTSKVGWYNEEHFTKAGITDMPTNFSEIYETGKKITEATGRPSFYLTIGEGEGLLNNVFSLANNEPIVKEGKTVIQDNKSILEFFDLSQKMFKEGIMPQENIEGTYPTAQEVFMAENISFVESGAQFVGPIKEGAPKVYEVAKPVKPFDNGQLPVNVSIMNFAIPAKTKNPKAAIELAKFVTNPENQLEFAKAAGTVLPSTKVSLEDKYFTDPEDNPIAKARTESAQTLKRSKVMDVQGKSRPELRDIIKTKYIETLLGNLSAEEALKEVAKEWDDIFEKNDEKPTF